MSEEAILIELQWSAVLREFAAFQRAGNLAEKTIANREACLRLLATRAGVGPAEVRFRDLTSMLGRLHYRTGTPLSGGTKQSERSYLQTFFEWAKAEGVRRDNPARRLPKVKIGRRKARPFHAAQVERMLDSGVYKRTRDIITIAALSGLRIGEVVRIRGEDVDWDAGTLFSLRKGALEHTVVLHPVLLELAKTYPRRGWWFPSPVTNKQFPEGGGHILMASASRRVSHAIRAAGIAERRLTGHSLRHFYATTLLREGASLRVVQEMMGHASLATTQLYWEVTEIEMHKAIVLLPDIRPREHSARVTVLPRHTYLEQLVA